MIIEFECSGGFAYLRLNYRVNTDEISPELAKELLVLVQKSGLPELEAGGLQPASPDPPGVLRYRLTLSDRGAVHSLEMNDLNVPPKLRPLLTRLQDLAIDQKG